MTVWSIDVAQLRETFLEFSAVGEPSGEGIVPTTVPEVLFRAFERGDVTELLVQVPRAAREIAEVIDTEVDEATGAFWAAVADEAWVGLAVRVDDVVTYPDLLGDSWRVIATSQDVCEVLSVVEFAELYPDDVPLLANFGRLLLHRRRRCSGKMLRTFSPSRSTRESKVSASEILCCQIFESRQLKLWVRVGFSGFECVKRSESSQSRPRHTQNR